MATILLAAAINSSQREFRVEGEITSEHQVGYRFRIGSEALELAGFVQERFGSKPFRRDNPRYWRVTRGIEGTTAASASQGDTIYALAPEFVTSSSASRTQGVSGQDGDALTEDDVEELIDNAIEGIVYTRERTFTETTGAGTYEATVAIPAGAWVTRVAWKNTALWTALTSATLDCGDGDDPDGYFSAVDLKAAPAADVNGAGGSDAFHAAADPAYDGIEEVAGKFYASAGTITATVVTVGATGNAGRSRLLVEYTLPGTTAALKT